MIERFNEVPRRDSAIIYGSSLEQIQQYYEMDPAAAGELAISIIELALTGQMSTNNPLIKMALANFKDVAVKKDMELFFFLPLLTSTSSGNIARTPQTGHFSTLSLIMAPHFGQR